MMYCPDCLAEYATGITRCADCDIDLVEALPAAKATHGDLTGRIVTVFSTRDPGLAAVAESLLQSAGIRFSVRGMALPYPGALPVELQVLEGDADEAHAILAGLSTPDA